jgi:hypothetical protein
MYGFGGECMQMKAIKQATVDGFGGLLFNNISSFTFSVEDSHEQRQIKSTAGSDD